ncbi:MAG: hypothetical protein Q7J72_08370 [Candidatus Omnitrophota bacterium]|nr:hypothetical protein [Candidatus Omnitrophota bacterium]
MKRKIGVVAMMFVFLAIAALAFSESAVKVNPEATIGEFIGNTTVYLSPTKFPKFSNGSSDNKRCARYLEFTMSSDPDTLPDRAYYINASGILPGYGRSEDKHCRYHNEFNETTGQYDCIKNGISAPEECGSIDCGNQEYVSLELNSNSVNSINIPAGYRNIAKVLFTWTVRVVGNRPNECSRNGGKELNGLAIWPLLCHPWHNGKITQDFSGGQVQTQLYIKGSGTIIAKNADSDSAGWAPLDFIASMTVPAGPPGVVNEPGDPTITGSYIVTKDDFLNSITGKNTLPPIIYFKLMWHNDSPLVVESLANQRNVVAMLMPITDIEDEENE